MSTPFDEQIEELRTGYQARLAQIGELQRRMSEVTGTATAKAQAMKVTVGPQGELLSVEFPTGAYRSMAPKELSDLIVATVQEARGKATAALAEIMTPHLPEGLDAARLLRGTADVARLMPSEPAMPDGVREYVDQGRVGRRAGEGPRIAHD
ncbi:YbaB/EbfC family nucleoid-associated protein [Streptomyces dangxiongensis]|uniref:YbaB/EbfC family nucleoid-associated protein n=1 Tax=Streptomyces dangxiongensis TaxID=1442032 RepID=UPI0013CE6767|nr:YbaB/EbfC family nucleoid-associated protein [Streptomyces dangxiongensis]